MNRVRRFDDKQIDVRELVQRSILALFSALAVLLPIFNITFAAELETMPLGDPRLLAMAAYLLPAAYFAGLATVFVDGMRPHARFIDLTGVLVCAGALVRTAYVLFFDVTQETAVAETGSVILGHLATVSLGGGSVPLLLLLLGGAWQLRKSWRD